MLASIGTRPPESPDELISPQLAAALDQLDLASRRTFLGKLQGERHSKARGRSVEFEDYRQYAAGDDLRHIDWNVFARLDRFFIKIFQEEQDLSLHIVLDASPSMDAGQPNKLLFAQRLAMALGYLGLVSNNRLIVSIFGHRKARSPDGLAAQALAQLSAIRGRSNVPRLSQFLLESTFGDSATVRATGDAAARGTFNAAMRTLAATRSGRGVMVILSDLMIPVGYEDGLRLLSTGSAGNGGGGGAGSGWDATLVQILAPGEIDPSRELDAAGRRTVLGDLRLTDAETGRAVEVTVTDDLLAGYRKRFDRYQKTLAAFAASRGMGHLVVPSDTDITTLMLSDMRRVGVLK